MSEKKYLPDHVSSYDELLAVFDEFRVDSEKTRFFVGRDYYDPMAFVINRNVDGEFIVYKMKGDGSKAVRYQGFNERKAVNEFYSKFLSEVSKRPEYAKKLLRTDRTVRSTGNTNTRISGTGAALIGIISVII
ncbi:MAG: hypothetical protein IKS69_06105, partial [Erysipelotrichaceae bacterium]|nr:hypothetical protein [Erysipelotrichaceae bacterium]